MISINSWEISTWPRAQICKEFGNINQCTVQMLNGITMEILFTAYGFPLVKESLIHQIEKYFNKKYVEIKIDNDKAYACVVRRSRNNGVNNNATRKT